MQRVRIGLTGLAFVFLAVLLAAIFTSQPAGEAPITPNLIEQQKAGAPAAPPGHPPRPSRPSRSPNSASPPATPIRTATRRRRRAAAPAALSCANSPDLSTERRKNKNVGFQARIRP